MVVSDIPRVVWSTEQRAVIEAEPSGFTLVDAPPGTGKTAIACARVAWLIDRGVDPSNILLLSFTRTAVAELRERIGRMSKSIDAAAAVLITTLDSACWSLRYGFTDDDVQKLFGGYDVNIERVTEMMRSRHTELLEHFAGLGHIIVDEAQDLTGARALFVLELLAVLPKGCGTTVFADPAQAIYGFTSADSDVAEGSGKREEGLIERLRRQSSITIDERGLTHVYRTNSRSLIRLFLEVRKDLLQAEDDPADRYEAVKEAIRDAADDRVAAVEEFGPAAGDRGLILYRRRIEALFASSLLSNMGVRHRLRMSGLPVCLHPWIGAVLSGVPTDELDRARFDEAWRAIEGASALRKMDPDVAWALLRRTAGDGRGGVSGRRLRTVLSRSRPPAEFCQPDVGDAGPIVGTIHASKGREAPDVYLMIPGLALPEDRMDYEEESRVLYVGATRARERLYAGAGSTLKGSRNLNPSGRAFRTSWSKDKVVAQVEFGRDGDVMPNWIVSDDGLSRAETERVQAWLFASVGRDVRLSARLHHPDYRYLAQEMDGSEPPIARFAKSLSDDIFEIAKVCEPLAKRSLKPSFSVKHLWCVGARTIVLPPDHADLSRLHRPYAESGIFLAPIIKGFTQVYFNGR